MRYNTKSDFDILSNLRISSTFPSSVARLASIFLLFAFVLHIGGYYFISFTWGQYERRLTAARIENETYRVEETVTFKLPLTLPYAPTVGNFEAAQGSFEHQGEFYRLVKQKLQGDTLYVVVIKDVREKMIFGYMSDFVKESSDVDGAKEFKLLNGFTKDYVGSVRGAVISQYGWSYELGRTVPVLLISNARLAVESPPPDAA